MKPLIVASLLSLALSVPTLADPSSQTYSACVREALVPVTSSAAYRNGSVREKRALLNSYKAEVSRNRAACKKA